MVNKKKRTGLDALGLSAETSLQVEKANETELLKETEKLEKPEKSKLKSEKNIAKTTVYVPQAVYEQWRKLAFTERKKMHDYLLEGLNMVFQNRGLKSVEDLTNE